jgi:hypothetical protein
MNTRRRFLAIFAWHRLQGCPPFQCLLPLGQESTESGLLDRPKIIPHGAGRTCNSSELDDRFVWPFFPAITSEIQGGRQVMALDRFLRSLQPAFNRRIPMLKMIFSPSPGWISDVEKNGKDALAEILSDPQHILKGVAGYQGRDGWIDVQAQIYPLDDAQFEGKMKCRFSQAIGGMLERGMRVNVKYDPKHRTRILLVDDINKLLSYRLKS